MSPSFFPNPEFAWAFLALFFALLVLASGTDLRSYLIPKAVTLTGLALGLAANLARGIWLGIDGKPVWLLGEHGVFVAAADGLLFALVGFAVSFALFFLMWLAGVCGGGDVKLFAAVGAWIGAYLGICVLMMTIPVILCLALGQMALALSQRTPAPATNAALPAPVAAGKKPRRVLGFSVPLTIAAVAVLLWMFRVELHLAAGAFD